MEKQSNDSANGEQLLQSPWAKGQKEVSYVLVE